MAFNLRALENRGGSTGFMRTFTYTTTDNKAAVKAANYFDAAAGLLKVGDRIQILASDANFDSQVSAISGAGAVTIAALATFA
jgi:hypothetical protein